MKTISVSADTSRRFSVRGDIYYPVDWDESINDAPPDDVYHYVICVRSGDTPADDGSVPLYELCCHPDIDWSKPDSLTVVNNPNPYTYEIFDPYYDDDCTVPADAAITIDGVEYVFCVRRTGASPELDDGLLTLTSYAMRGHDTSVYAITWHGHIDYDKAEVDLYTDRGLLDGDLPSSKQYSSIEYAIKACIPDGERILEDALKMARSRYIEIMSPYDSPADAFTAVKVSNALIDSIISSWSEDLTREEFGKWHYLTKSLGVKTLNVYGREIDYHDLIRFWESTHDGEKYLRPLSELFDTHRRKKEDTP